jgi:uncharacterized protein (DUF1499 family)
MTAIVIGTLATVGLAAIGVRLWLSRPAESRVAPQEIVDFAQLRPGARPNRYVMCPTTLCADAADAPSPIFEMRWERLRDYWNEAVALQPRVELAAQDAERRKLTYIQRSFFFHFPDIVTVEFLPAGEGSSTLAVASQSRYGRADFGVNAARVESWTELLVSMMREEQVGSTR